MLTNTASDALKHFHKWMKLHQWNGETLKNGIHSSFLQVALTKFYTLATIVCLNQLHFLVVKSIFKHFPCSVRHTVDLGITKLRSRYRVLAHGCLSVNCRFLTRIFVSTGFSHYLTFYRVKWLNFLLLRYTKNIFMMKYSAVAVMFFMQSHSCLNMYLAAPHVRCISVHYEKYRRNVE